MTSVPFNMTFLPHVLTRQQKIEMLAANMRRRELELDLIKAAHRAYTAEKQEEELRNLRAENDTHQPTSTDTGLQNQAATPENAEKP